MRVAVYPGTFDPVTNGHLDIVQRSTRIFDQVILSVAEDNYKNTLFSTEERVALLRESTVNLSGVSVETFHGLLVDYVRSRGSRAVVRGLRAISDFEWEFQMSMMNKKLSEEVETVFLMTSSENLFVSSSIIKQVAALGGSVSRLVPPGVEEALRKKYSNNQSGV